MFQTVIGHLYAGARAYPYVLTQRCNDISFSQVVTFRREHIDQTFASGFWGRGFWCDSRRRTSMLLPVTIASISMSLYNSFFQGMPLWKLRFLRSRPLSGGVWAISMLQTFVWRNHLHPNCQPCLGNSLSRTLWFQKSCNFGGISTNKSPFSSLSCLSA